MPPIKFGVGQSVARKEDDALIRGKGRYTDDVAPARALHALVLRSPHAHARFRIDVTRARSLPGVGLTPAAKTLNIHRIFETEIMYFGPRTPAALRKIAGWLHPGR